MRIKDVENLVGVSKKNIRFYEQQGLLSPGRTTENSYREYSAQDAERLKRIKLLRKLDMPIAEIKDILDEGISLRAACGRHMHVLASRIESLSKAERVCQSISDEAASLEALDADGYLRELDRMEREGVVFVDIEKRDVRKKYVAASIAGGLMAALFLAIGIGFIYTCSTDPEVPVWLTIIMGTLLLLAPVCTVAALISRIKEIKGGEENDLGKY